jgi:hypothetical protein
MYGHAQLFEKPGSKFRHLMICISPGRSGQHSQHRRVVARDQRINCSIDDRLPGSADRPTNGRRS